MGNLFEMSPAPASSTEEPVLKKPADKPASESGMMGKLIRWAKDHGYLAVIAGFLAMSGGLAKESKAGSIQGAYKAGWTEKQTNMDQAKVDCQQFLDLLTNVLNKKFVNAVDTKAQVSRNVSSFLKARSKNPAGFVQYGEVMPMLETMENVAKNMESQIQALEAGGQQLSREDKINRLIAREVLTFAENGRNNPEQPF